MSEESEKPPVIDLRKGARRRVEGCRTFPVAGGAYGNRARRRGEGVEMLTHAWDPVRANAICRKVRPESVLVDYAYGGIDDPPTCAICRARDARFPPVATARTLPPIHSPYASPKPPGPGGGTPVE